MSKGFADMSFGELAARAAEISYDDTRAVRRNMSISFEEKCTGSPPEFRLTIKPIIGTINRVRIMRARWILPKLPLLASTTTASGLF